MSKNDDPRESVQVRLDHEPQSASLMMRIIAGPIKSVRIIILLVLVILLLLWALWQFGIGGGSGGKDKNAVLSLPDSVQAETVPVTPPEKKPQKIETQNKRTPTRFELIISFMPTDTYPEEAKRNACILDWIHPKTKAPKMELIETGNKTDFEFALQKGIRAWRQSLEEDPLIEPIPTLSIRMNPFPGEGTFQRIGQLAQEVDEKINIQRLGKE